MLQKNIAKQEVAGQHPLMRRKSSRTYIEEILTGNSARRRSAKNCQWWLAVF
jgi:hypothetical protein